MEIIIASNNKGKIKEIKEIFSSHSITSMGDAGINIEIEETGSTFLENAIIKAKTIYQIVKKPVLSDDSGLLVDSLNGEPGVYSARYSGKTTDTDYHNNILLLKNLDGKQNRSARFVSAVVLYYGDNKYIYAEGETKGEILLAPVGSEGFGYDPLFYSFELKKSFSEASLAEKNTVSHRARALKKLAGLMTSI